MKNIYDDRDFFESYSRMTRSRLGLEGSGEWPSVRKLLPELDGMDILDLGCGYGWHARYFIENGAKSVTAIDSSQKMINKAEEINSVAGISYSAADIECYDIPKGKYGMIFSSLAFHYIKDFSSLSAKIYEGLRRGGVLLFSCEHPTFTAEGSEDWCYDGKGNIKHFPVDNYFIEGLRNTSFLGAEVPKYHRTLTTYINTLLDSGFDITGLSEPEVPEHLKNLEEMKNEYRRPMMLIIRAEKREEK